MNTDISRSAPASSALPERAALRAQLEETRMAFHALVESLTEEEWHSKTATTAWTVCDVLTHLADGLARLPAAMAHVRQGKNYFNLPLWLRDSLIRWLTTWSARGQTPESILRRYDQAYSALLATLEGIRDDEWSRGAQCYGDGYKTVLDLCVLPKSHFQELAAQVAPRK
jgi:DinB superfamily